MGWQSAPQRLSTGNFFGDKLGKMRQGKKVRKWEMLKKMRKNGKGKEENEEKLKNFKREGRIFFLLFTFRKPLKLYVVHEIDDALLKVCSLLSHIRDEVLLT